MLLRHKLPDGSWHFDWLIDRGSALPLVSFRVLERVDIPTITEFFADRIGDHRREYLQYEGPVSDGRGNVQRMASGIVESLSEDPDHFQITVSFGTSRRSWTGTRIDAGRWRFEVSGPDSVGRST